MFRRVDAAIKTPSYFEQKKKQQLDLQFNIVYAYYPLKSSDPLFISIEAVHKILLDMSVRRLRESSSGGSAAVAQPGTPE